jgi:hypothetical protein
MYIHVTDFFFYIVQRNKICVFLEDLLPYITSEPYFILSGVSVASTSQFRASVMLELPIAGN